MKFLVLNGSPRKNGNVAKTLKSQIDFFSRKFGNEKIETKWIDVQDLQFDFCKGCMACRSRGHCQMQADDAHKIEEELKTCDYLFVGTPVYWANMNGKLKALFDRLVAIFMGESKSGIPVPLNKGKKAVIVTSCTTPFPFNYLCGQTSGAVRSVKEILKTAGFKICRTVNHAGTKK